MQTKIDQLQAFIAAAERGSFSAAARALGKAQSAVSTAVANLEIELGVTLFDRGGRDPVLTDQGRALLPHAQAVIEQLARFHGRAGALAAGEEGHLSLAIEEALTGPWLDALLAQFAERFPQLELQLASTSRLDIQRLVEANRIDIGLLVSTLAKPEGFRIQPLRPLPFIGVAGRGHPLAAQSTHTFDELSAHRQLLLSTAEGEIIEFDGLSRQRWTVESHYGLMELVARNIGWAWLPQHLAQPMLQSGALVRLRFEHGAEQMHSPVDLITRFGYREGSAGRWLCRQLAEAPILGVERQ